MGRSIITLKEVREKLARGEKLNLVYCKFDQKLKTGGERAELFNVVSTSIRKSAALIKKQFEQEAENITKDPHHQFNGTVNVRLPNTEIKKIHWILIEKCNGKQVVI